MDRSADDGDRGAVNRRRGDDATLDALELIAGCSRLIYPYSAARK
jgi:hypothetical protein